MISQQLETFLLVAETGSFAKASEKLYVTPASVMHQINLIENRLGMKLLTRTNRGVFLTDAGKSLYTSGIQIQRECADAIIKAKGQMISEDLYIRVGSSFLNPASVLLDKWEPIKHKYPGFCFSIVPYIDDYEHIETILDLVGKEIDVLVGRFNSRMIRQNVQFLALGRYNCCVAVPHKHPLANKKLVTVEDMHGERVILGKSGNSLHIIRIRDMLKKEHPQIQILDTDYYFDMNTFNMCEKQGALLITLDAWANLHPSLVTIPVAWDYTVDYGILCDKSPNEKTEKFLEVLATESILPRNVLY